MSSAFDWCGGEIRTRGITKALRIRLFATKMGTKIHAFKNVLAGVLNDSDKSGR